jgi:hypothetical protein
VQSELYAGLGWGVEVDDGAVRTCADAKVVEETKSGRMRARFISITEARFD